MSTAERRTPWVALAVGLDLVLAVVDAATGNGSSLTSTFLFAPLLLAIVAGERPVALIGALSTVLAVASGWWDDYFGTTDHVVRVLVVAAGSGLAVLAARARYEAATTRERLDRILGALAEAVTVHDEHGKTVYANDAAVRLLGAVSRDEILRAEPGELAQRFTINHEDGRPVALDEFPGRRAVEGRAAAPLLTRSIERLTGRELWLLTKATVVREGGRMLAVNVIEDVTEAKNAELRQRFLAEAGAVLAGSLDYEETLDRVAHLAVPDLADWCMVDVVDERLGLRRVALAHADPGALALAERLRGMHPPLLPAPADLDAVLRSGDPQLHAELAGAPMGMRSAMAVPMRVGDRVIGVLSFVTGSSERVLDRDDLAFAQDIAVLAAAAVENARLYTERTLASETLQRSLLPERLPELAGWSSAARYRPGGLEVEVGGDFYDVFAVPGGFMAVLGDVTGKGVGAAALTALARHTVRTGAMFDPRPASVLALLNRVLRGQHRLSFVTMACALARDDGTATVASAGHPLPLLLPASGGVEGVGAHGMLLGAEDRVRWPQHDVHLAPGDTLLFYTDGVTDTVGGRERFGEERLQRLAADAPRDPPLLLEALEAAIAAFATQAGHDDRAMLALRRESG